MRTIPLTLTPDQAVVLLGLLASSRLASQHSCEQLVLQEIEGQLERQLLKTLEPDDAITPARVNAA